MIALPPLAVLVIVTVLSLVLVNENSCVKAQSSSPCPLVFQYEARNADNSDRWYGNIVLQSVEDLNGIWINVKLDRKASLLGNWIGDTSSSDNREFLIINQKYRLKAGVPSNERFFVKYPTEGESYIPSLKEIRLNGKVICSASVANPYPREDCGRVTKARPLITRGTLADIGNYPWHAAIYKYEGINLAYRCGGSLITKKHVITVAHCATESINSNKAMSPEMLVVYLGKQSLRNFRGPTLQDADVAKITVHPGYNYTRLSNDVAVLKLAIPVEITDNVRTICLWQEDIGLPSILYRLGTVVGFGFDESGQLSDQLQVAKLPIVARDTCIYSDVDFFAHFTSSTNYCAGHRNGTSVCNGDSGGGMAFIKENTERNSIWQLRGIVSLSAPEDNANRCNTQKYVIFTDVAKYLPWIKELIQQ